VPTSDKATLWVDSAVIYRIKDPENAVFNVADVGKQVVEKSQEILRHEFSGRILSDVLTHRDICEERIKKSVLGIGDSWGVDVKDLILKDIRFPESMERSLGRGAEADAEGQAKLTHARYEKEAAKILAEAGTVYEKNPAAMKLREMSVQLSMAKEGKGTNTIFFPVHEVGKMLSSIPKL
jgi:regulator of protease activity HflC (stomatin/prohibitin superfamily)